MKDYKKLLKTRIQESEFQYHSTSLLKDYIGKEVLWLDLFGVIRLGKLEGTVRAYLNEACNPFADTVKIRLI